MIRDLMSFSAYIPESGNTTYSGVVSGRKMPTALIVLTVLCLTVMTVFAQEQALGLSFIEHTQLMRHHAVLSGAAPDPWAYRLLSEWIVALVLRLSEALHFARPAVVGFLTLRALQNVAIFLLAISYYRRLGMAPQFQSIGVVLLAWSMSHALYNSDLSVNTYFDVIAYLIAAHCVITGRPWALVPIVIVAAFNRDTAAMIPMMAVAPLLARAANAPRSSLALLRSAEARRPLAVAVVGLVAFAAVYIGIRKVIGPAPWPWGNTGGTMMLQANLRDTNVHLYVPLTFSILPLLAFWRWRQLPPLLRGFLLLLGPVWATTLFVLVYVAETRLFLVPIAVAFIPAALFVSPDVRAVRRGIPRTHHESVRLPTTSSELPNGSGRLPSSRSSSRETV
jgi:hypothetical protein